MSYTHRVPDHLRTRFPRNGTPAATFSEKPPTAAGFQRLFQNHSIFTSETRPDGTVILGMRIPADTQQKSEAEITAATTECLTRTGVPVTEFTVNGVKEIKSDFRSPTGEPPVTARLVEVTLTGEAARIFSGMERQCAIRDEFGRA